jgi:hypothetical protein
MGFRNYMVVHAVDPVRMEDKIRLNLGLYESGALTDFEKERLFIDVLDGEHGCGLTYGDVAHEEIILMNILAQMGATYLIGRFQDGDAWAISLYRGHEHLISRDVNPWAYGDGPTDRDQANLDLTTERIAAVWKVDPDTIRPYLLLWREKTLLGWRDRNGKAYPTDEFPYGDAHQLFDFLGRLGFAEERHRVRIKWS